MGKRGNVKQFFVMFEVVFAAIIVLGMLLFVKGITESTDLEKEYLARDIALLLGTVYASPGDLSYTYYIPKNKLDIEISEGKVIVSDSGLRPASYNYAEDSEIKNPKFNMQKPKEITFIKTRNEIRIEGI